MIDSTCLQFGDLKICREAIVGSVVNPDPGRGLKPIVQLLLFTYFISFYEDEPGYAEAVAYHEASVAAPYTKEMG